MNPRALRAVSMLALPVLILASASCSPEPDTTSTGIGRLSITTEVGTIAFDVEIADSDASRQRGLMDRTDLPDGTGMAFLFDDPTTARFWMKDTLIPLSIAFWDADRRIVGLLDMEPCMREPCPLYGPDAPYVGAVEVPLGALVEVSIGDVVELERD